jgi:ribosomal subunit interface protein
MDVVVTGRNVEVPDHYRQLVAEKLDRLKKHDQKVIRVDVELHHEPNRRQSSACQHVQITCRTRGPVVRAEACAADFYAALDAAVAKLEARFRKAADRRRTHRGRRRPPSMADVVDRVGSAPAETFGGLAAPSADDNAADENAFARVSGSEAHEHVVPLSVDGSDGPGRIVRWKDHESPPITVDQALLEMELVGHDFFLFPDAETGLPSVVYRRRGYDYGVIRLSTLPAEDFGEDENEAAADDAQAPASDSPERAREFAGRS